MQMDKLRLEMLRLVKTCCKAGFRCEREHHFPTARLLVVEMEGVVSISTPWEKHWEIEEARDALANESSHEIQTKTAVYYFSHMCKNLLINTEESECWPYVKCSLCRLKNHHVKNRYGSEWTLSRFVLPPRELRKMFWGFVTFAGKFQQTLVLISTQRPDLPLNRDNSSQTAMTFAEQEARLNPDLTQIH